MPSLRRKARLQVVEKAPTPPKGGKDIAPLVQALTSAFDAMNGTPSSPLPRPAEWDSAQFGPGLPLSPEPLDEPRSDTGLPEPRIWQYPMQWNVPGVQGRHVVPWETLKQAGESPLFRACIEVRKEEILGLDWIVDVDPAVVRRLSATSGKSKQDIEKELRSKYQEDIDRAGDFWANPDRQRGQDYGSWMGLLIEEWLTWDAMAIYPRKTYGGELLNFRLIDGSTIKPLLDEYGGRPEPPFPAYQQLLYGFPRGEFTADTVDVDGNAMTPGALSAAQLVYRRRVERNWTPYGFSPTEQALLDGMLWSKRFQWMLAEYTEGSQPVQWIINHGTSEWSPKQLLEYERAFNDRYSGQTSERYRNPMLPDGLEPVSQTQVPDRYKPDYDLFLIKLCAMHYGVTMTSLGLTEPGGLGSSGYHEGQADVQFRRNLPTTRWFAAMLSQMQRVHLKTDPALAFRFLGLDDDDEAASDEVGQNRVTSARMTINEDRARIGLPAVDVAEADMLIQHTQRGMVFIDGASKLAPPGVLVEPASEQLGTDPATGAAPAPNAGYSHGAPRAATKPPASGGGASDSAKAEIATFTKWAAKRKEGSRPFQFEHVTAELAADLAPGLLTDERALLAKAAGGAAPKASSPASGPDGKRIFSSQLYTSRS